MKKQVGFCMTFGNCVDEYDDARKKANEWNENAKSINWELVRRNHH